MFIDIALGLLIGSALAFFSGESYSLFLFLGVGVTLLPDLDFLVWLVRRRGRVDQYAHEHRDLFHNPLLFGVGGSLLIAWWQPLYGLLWLCATTAHFIHDTFDGGWGIRWLYPFSPAYFTLAPHSPKHYIKDKSEQRLLAKHGNAHWLDEQYFVLDAKLLRELFFLGTVLVLLVIGYFSY